MARSGCPWEKRKWRNGIIRPSRVGFIVIGIMGLVFVGIGTAAVMSAENALKLPLNKENIALLFPVIGVCMLIASVVMACRLWKYRGTMFRMETMPGIIGGKLRGVLVVPDVLGGDGQIDISLVNEERKRTGSGKNSHTFVHILFQHDMSVNAGDYSRSGVAIAGLGQIEIPVEFVLPYDTKDQTDNCRKNRTSYSYRWLLKAKADVPGLDMNFEFDVPVFRTEQSSDAVTTDTMETEAAQEKLHVLKADRSRLEEIEIVNQSGYEHYFSKGRGPGFLIFGMIVLAIGFGLLGHGISNAINNSDGSSGSGIGKIIAVDSVVRPAIIGLGVLFVGGICFLGGLFIMGRRDVYVAGGVVNYHKKLAMLNFNKQIGRDFIIDVTVKKCGRTGNKKFYAVRVDHTDLSQVSAIERFVWSKLPSNRELRVPLEVVRGIGDKAEALWLADRLKEQLGI